MRIRNTFWVLVLLAAPAAVLADPRNAWTSSDVNITSITPTAINYTSGTTSRPKAVSPL